MKPGLILILIVTGFSFNCKSTKTAPSDYKKGIITFGSGGGFSGAYHEFMLLEDGRLYHGGLGDTSSIYIKNVDKNLTKQFFENVKVFGLDKLQYNEPQNMYSFIKIKNGSDSNYIAWSGKPEGVLEGVNAMHRLLMTQTKIDK